MAKKSTKKNSSKKAPKKSSKKTGGKKSSRKKREAETKEREPIGKIIELGVAGYIGQLVKDDQGQGYRGLVFAVETVGRSQKRGEKLHDSGLLQRDDAVSSAKEFVKQHVEHLRTKDAKAAKLQAEAFKVIDGIESEIIEEEEKIEKLSRKVKDHKARIKELHAQRREYLRKANDPQMEFVFSGASGGASPTPERSGQKAPNPRDELSVLTDAQAKRKIQATDDVGLLGEWLDVAQKDGHEMIIKAVEVRLSELRSQRDAMN